jgi:hypothetical protein
MNYTRTSARSLLLKVSDGETEHLYVTLPHGECVETGLGLDWDCASMPREEVLLAKCFIQFACVIARFGSCDHASKLYKTFWLENFLSGHWVQRNPREIQAPGISTRCDDPPQVDDPHTHCSTQDPPDKD